VKSWKLNSLANAIFLDRDGVLNRKAPAGAYVTDLTEFEFLPGSLEAMAELYRRRYLLFVMTNQRGTATGATSIEAAESIHRH
jgi:D-glycero-D-manno-heptose 1,7-bisphosphate phosphatase